MSNFINKSDLILYINESVKLVKLLILSTIRHKEYFTHIYTKIQMATKPTSIIISDLNLHPVKKQVGSIFF